MIGKFVFFKECFVEIRNIFGKSGKELPIRNQKCDYKKVSAEMTFYQRIYAVSIDWSTGGFKCCYEVSAKDISRISIITDFFDGITGIFCIIHNAKMFPYIFLPCFNIKTGKIRVCYDARLQLQRIFVSIRDIIAIEFVSYDNFRLRPYAFAIIGIVFSTVRSES